MHKRIAAVLAVLFAAQIVFAQSAAERLEAVRHDPLRLRQFLEAMPKGGDLHNHLSGDVYAESYLQWAANDGMCLDPAKLSIVAVCDEKLTPAATALTTPLYPQMLDALSMRQFRGTSESGHDHFFATFAKFSASAKQHVPDMMREALQRFANENVVYAEIIYSPDRGAASKLGATLTKGASFADMRDQLFASEAFKAVVADARKTLDAGDAAAPRDIDYRIIYEVHRTYARESLFAELVTAFEVAKADGRVVAVNPVAPEDAYTSMTTFDELMRMFAFFRPLYPNVHVSAHAGELAPGLVPPEGLRNHIRDSVEIAHAERIGHGVDVARERNSQQLLETMAQRRIAVEVCLTSNDVILGIRGSNHPLPMYLRAGVPVTLASDDPGVSRADLTTEYQRAAEEFGLTYDDLKRISRNALEYSFLDGRSLFVDHDYDRRACEASECGTLAAASAKARAQLRLEERFSTFEAAQRPPTSLRQ